MESKGWLAEQVRQTQERRSEYPEWMQILMKQEEEYFLNKYKEDDD